TPALYDFTAPTGSSASVPIGGYFSLYYAAHGGEALLGAPITPVYPIAGGWVQIFSAGALIYPTGHGASATGAPGFGNPSQPTFAGSVRDDVTGIIRLPLIQPLLRAGSLVSVAGAGSHTPSYADLRQQITSIALAPARDSRGGTAGGGEPSFTYQQGGRSNTGQIIPQAIWQFMNRSDIAPDGWQADIGMPLTLPVSMTTSTSDGVHQLQVQVFFHAALVEDDGVSGVASVPVISALPTGLAYLQTLGPPAASLSNVRHAWVTGDAAVLDAPGAGQPRAQLGLNFPVSLTGGTRWIGDDLWYAIHWTGPKASGDGWLDAATLSFTPPGSTASVWSGFDALSPALASYLSGLGGDTGAAVYDETHNRYYTYNANNGYIMASSAKVPIMITFLEMTEAQHRQPTDDEMYLLTTMIEISDNDSAEALWLEEGGAGAVAAMMRGLGISGLQPDYDGEWGYSTVAPLAMVQLLTALHDGRVLNAQDRALALGLMSQIESDQQTGVGSTAPRGASYWMKDGWVPASNGLWAMNSSGIVTLGGETYIIAVYSQNKGSLDDGWGIAEHVCGAVGQLLTS
ncbi:MAG TPA: serine hydrolase, partial [Ktedonobacterales bacterium]|nr:serine hydrolase [Ktedonobacterales bacterium]